MATMTTAPWVGGMKGRLSTVYFAQTRHGTQMRPLPNRRAPATDGELAQRARIRRIGAAWRLLDREAVLAWRGYAESLAGDPANPSVARVGAYNAYSALGSTLLRLRPEGALPESPPSGPFFGDAAIVQALDTPSREEPSPLGGSAEGGDDRPRRGESFGVASQVEGRVGVPLGSDATVRVAGGPGDPTPTPPQGEGTGRAVVFRASQGNAAGVVTELLIQPLLSAGRTPRPKAYVSAGFVVFAEGALEASVEVPAGWVACAYRFVRADTGQETALAPCGVVRA